MNKAYREMLLEEGFSAEEVEFLDEYRESLPPESKCTEFDINDILSKVCNGNREAGNELVMMYMHRVIEEAIEQREEGVAVGDLISEGNLALTEKVVEFCNDPTTIPSDVDEVLTDVIWNAIHDYVIETKMSVVSQESVVERANAMLDSIDKLTRELGFKPNIDEIANDMGVAQADVIEILKLVGEDVDEEGAAGNESLPDGNDNYIGNIPKFK